MDPALTLVLLLAQCTSLSSSSVEDETYAARKPLKPAAAETIEDAEHAEVDQLETSGSGLCGVAWCVGHSTLASLNTKITQAEVDASSRSCCRNHMLCRKFYVEAPPAGVPPHEAPCSMRAERLPTARGSTSTARGRNPHAAVFSWR